MSSASASASSVPVATTTLPAASATHGRALRLRRDKEEIDEYRVKHGYHMYLVPSSNKSDKAFLLIMGPSETHYQYAPFLFRVDLPHNYPNSPPRCEYLSVSGHRIHPNIYAEGKVCLSILGTWRGPGWKASMGLNTLALNLYSLLNTSNPLSCEPGFEQEEDNPSSRSHNYNKFVKFVSFIDLTSIYCNAEKVIPPEDEASNVVNIYLKQYLKRKLSAIERYGERLYNENGNKQYTSEIYGASKIKLTRETKDRVITYLRAAVEREFPHEDYTRHQLNEVEFQVEKPENKDTDGNNGQEGETGSVHTEDSSPIYYSDQGFPDESDSDE